MANTTNFGWETPDDTDLVKDGAAAMRTLGNAIDTSFVDLKGGTTGQILSKASNTDLDYTWVSPNPGDITGVTAGTGISGGGTSGDVTITNSMATAIDAKGDLIAGTGADAFARLAVGTNGHYLVADSTASTGLNWSNVKRQSFTPTWGVVSGTTPTLGNGSLTGNYVRVGDMVYFSIRLAIGSTTNTGSGAYTFTLPIATTSSEFALTGSAQALDAGVAWYSNYRPDSVQNGYTDKFVILNPTGAASMSNTVPITFATNDIIYVWGVYAI